MRDKSHIEQIERWASYIKNTPRSVWKPQFNQFIDSQFEMAKGVYERLAKTKEGREKLRLIREHHASR